MFEMPPENRNELLAKMEVKPSEKEKLQQSELPKADDKTHVEKIPVADKDDKSTAPKADDKMHAEKIPAADKDDKSTAPKADDKTHAEKIPAADKDDKSTAPKADDKMHAEKIPAANLNPLLTQTDVGKVFGNYYRAISERRYTDAYLYLTAAYKSRLGSVEDFAIGHKDTLSVEIIDFQQVGVSAEAMSATYKILTHDKVADGVKVQIFDGTATMIKTGDKWLIDNLSSVLVETEIIHQ